MQERIATREAQVRALAARLNPHFLFNSLNAIRALVAEDADRAREMLTRLSSFLRHAISIDPAVPSTLGQEMETARAYLRIEEARFEPDLEVDVDLDPDATDTLGPPLLLQPLVENAVRYGAPGSDGVLRIRLDARMERDGLRLELANTGTLAERPEGVGLGLSRSRLRLMYGDAQRITLAERDGRVIARIEIDAPRRVPEPGGSR
jgi:LytS/YehU family sensor histidine kinase